MQSISMIVWYLSVLDFSENVKCLNKIIECSKNWDYRKCKKILTIILKHNFILMGK